MADADIRWVQRFDNFKRAFLGLEAAVEIKSPSVVEQAGLIQFFEISFELAWKLLKDYLEEEGFVVKSPRETIKQAFQAGLVSNGHAWLAALKARNSMLHTYSESVSLEVAKKIKSQHFPLLQALQNDFQLRADSLEEEE